MKMKKHVGGGAAGKKPLRVGTRAESVIPIGVHVGGRRVTAGCTLNVSEGGALLVCSEDVPIGTEMEVTNLRSHELLACRVVWRAEAHESGRFGLGVEILNADRATASASDAGEHDEKKR